MSVCVSVCVCVHLKERGEEQPERKAMQTRHTTPLRPNQHTHGTTATRHNTKMEPKLCQFGRSHANHVLVTCTAWTHQLVQLRGLVDQTGLMEEAEDSTSERPSNLLISDIVCRWNYMIRYDTIPYNVHV